MKRLLVAFSLATLLTNCNKDTLPEEDLLPEQTLEQACASMNNVELVTVPSDYVAYEDYRFKTSKYLVAYGLDRYAYDNGSAEHDLISHLTDYGSYKEVPTVTLEVTTMGGHTSTTRSIVNAISHYGRDNVIAKCIDAVDSGGADLLLIAGKTYATEGCIVQTHRANFTDEEGVVIDPPTETARRVLEEDTNVFRKNLYGQELNVSDACVTYLLENDFKTLTANDGLRLGFFDALFAESGMIKVRAGEEDRFTLPEYEEEISLEPIPD